MQCWAPKSSGREGGARGIPKNSTGAEGKGARRENTSWDQEPLDCGELWTVNWKKIVNCVKFRRASLRRSLGLPNWNCWQELWRGRLTQGQRSRSKYRRCSRLLAVEYKSRLQMLQALEVHIPKVMEGEEDFLGSETMVVILGLTVNNWRWSLHNYCVKVRLVCCREWEQREWIEMAQFRQQLATLSTSGGSHRDLAEKYRQVSPHCFKRYN